MSQTWKVSLLVAFSCQLFSARHVGSCGWNTFQNILYVETTRKSFLTSFFFVSEEFLRIRKFLLLAVFSLTERWNDKFIHFFLVKRSSELRKTSDETWKCSFVIFYRRTYPLLISSGVGNNELSIWVSFPVWLFIILTNFEHFLSHCLWNWWDFSQTKVEKTRVLLCIRFAFWVNEIKYSLSSSAIWDENEKSHFMFSALRITTTSDLCEPRLTVYHVNADSQTVETVQTEI